MKINSLRLREMLREWRRDIPVQSVWLHYKGGLYQVLGHALDTERGTVNIRYRRIDGPQFDPHVDAEIEFNRPAVEWGDVVDPQNIGRPVAKRFTRIAP